MDVHILLSSYMTYTHKLYECSVNHISQKKRPAGIQNHLLHRMCFGQYLLCWCDQEMEINILGIKCFSWLKAHPKSNVRHVFNLIHGVYDSLNPKQPVSRAKGWAWLCYKLNIRSRIVINPWVHQTSLYFATFRSRETFFGQSYNSGTHILCVQKCSSFSELVD